MTLLILSLAWLLGVAAAARFGWDAWPLAVPAAVAGAVALAPFRGRAAIVASLLPLLVLGGIWRYQSGLPRQAPDDIALLAGREPVTFRATVIDEPEVRDTSQRLLLAVHEARGVDGARQAASGRVLVTAGLFPRYRYGDRLEVTAHLRKPPRVERFDYREHLARRGVYAVADYPSIHITARDGGNPARAAVIRARDALGDALSRALPEPEASLARGIVLGQRSALPRWLTDDLARTGTTHIVAVSGFNVTLVAGLSLSLLAWLIGRRRAALAALGAVAAYTLLTGAGPSVVRAAVMGALFLSAGLAGRQPSTPTALAFALAAMTAVDPGLIRDIGFQLSAASTAGLILVAPRLAEVVWHTLGRADPATRTGPLRALVEALATTVAASLATLPISAVTFGSVSLVALPANVLVVPAFGVTFVLSALAALAGLVSADLALPLGVAAWAPLHYTVLAVHALAAVPRAAVSLPPLSLAHAAALYAMLAAAWLALTRPAVARLLLKSAALLRPVGLPVRAAAFILAAAALAPVAAHTGAAATDTPDPVLRVTFVDVGQGDAALIRGPDGHTVLVDGGPSGRRLLEAVGQALPPWDRRIDLVVLTHPQADHLSGLVDLVERYDVRGVLASDAVADSAAFRALAGAIRSRRVPVTEARPGASVDLGRGARLTVLAAGGAPSSNPNDAGVVLRLTMGRASFLFPGDREDPGLQSLLANVPDLRSTVLAVPHHGARSAALPALVAAVEPAVAVISAGEGNPFGHPHEETLAALAGIHVYRTDAHGNITVTTDGFELKVTTEHEGNAAP